jgi:hypothetical protein
MYARPPVAVTATIALSSCDQLTELEALVIDETRALGLTSKLRKLVVTISGSSRRHHASDAFRVELHAQTTTGNDIQVVRDPAVTGVEEEVTETVRDAVRALPRRIDRFDHTNGA